MRCLNLRLSLVKRCLILVKGCLSLVKKFLNFLKRRLNRDKRRWKLEKRWTSSDGRHLASRANLHSSLLATTSGMEHWKGPFRKVQDYGNFVNPSWSEALLQKQCWASTQLSSVLPWVSTTGPYCIITFIRKWRSRSEQFSSSLKPWVPEFELKYRLRRRQPW